MGNGKGSLIHRKWSLKFHFIISFGPYKTTNTLLKRFCNVELLWFWDMFLWNQPKVWNQCYIEEGTFLFHLPTHWCIHSLFLGIFWIYWLAFWNTFLSIKTSQFAIFDLAHFLTIFSINILALSYQSIKTIVYIHIWGKIINYFSYTKK